MYIFSLNIDLLIKKSVLFKKLIFQQKYVYIHQCKLYLWTKNKARTNNETSQETVDRSKSLDDDL